MEVRELRKGILVYYGVPEGKPVKVTGFYPMDEDILVCTENEYGPNAERGVDFMLPVPLTPKLLEKCGFKSLGSTDFWDRDLGKNIGQICLNPDNGAVWLCRNTIDARTNPTSVYYLHQLQNLFFALTGEELEINL